jgi:hypothetical protein
MIDIPLGDAADREQDLAAGAAAVVALKVEVGRRGGSAGLQDEADGR